MIVEGKIVGGGDLKVTGLINGENVGAGTVDDAFAPRWYLVEWYDGCGGGGGGGGANRGDGGGWVRRGCDSQSPSSSSDDD